MEFVNVSNIIMTSIVSPPTKGRVFHRRHAGSLSAQLHLVLCGMQVRASTLAKGRRQHHQYVVAHRCFRPSTSANLHCNQRCHHLFLQRVRRHVFTCIYIYIHIYFIHRNSSTRIDCPIVRSTPHLRPRSWSNPTFLQSHDAFDRGGL